MSSLSPDATALLVSIAAVALAISIDALASRSISAIVHDDRERTRPHRSRLDQMCGFGFPSSELSLVPGLMGASVPMIATLSAACGNMARTNSRPLSLSFLDHLKS